MFHSTWKIITIYVILAALLIPGLSFSYSDTATIISYAPLFFAVVSIIMIFRFVAWLHKNDGDNIQTRNITIAAATLILIIYISYFSGQILVSNLPRLPKKITVPQTLQKILPRTIQDPLVP